MAHFPKPFFRTARNAWFVQVGSRQIKLGPDKDEAFRRYHELMSAPQEIVPGQVDSELVVAVVDSFLEFVKLHRAPDTYRWYLDQLQRFVDFIPARLTLRQLKPYHVQQWIDSYKHLSDGSKRNLCRSIQRAMRWAEEQGYIERSPLAHFKKPPAGKREQVVSPTRFRSILDEINDEEFQDLLTVTWETGCRPQEALRVERRHVDVAGSRWIFPASESKGGKIPRVVYLTPVALKITLNLMCKYIEGPLFRNTDGRPWTPDATNCRFQTLKKKLKVKYSLYALRHTWMNRMLVSGVDAFTVATLAGHSDASMLAKHYAHLSRAPGYLLEQARRASA
jgi:integrase